MDFTYLETRPNSLLNRTRKAEGSITEVRMTEQICHPTDDRKQHLVKGTKVRKNRLRHRPLNSKVTFVYYT